MQAVIRSCVLLLCVTLVKSKNCTLENFLRGRLYRPNFDTTDMEASYADGRQVRVGCNVGFSGFFKLICQKGDWSSKGAGCQPRSCGHPGDAPFADFQLVNGTDFVFGSKVVYICNKGYHMVSRRNHRNCMMGGWDGAVPVCEAQQCPAIHVESNVKVIGEPEEAAFGNVVLFSCKSNSEILNGPLEVYCDETGEWSGIGWTGRSPKCEEIKCSQPIIENGVVLGDVQEYKENELLNYRCDPQFKVVSGMSSKCMKVGHRAEWSPTPMCELIKCYLQLPTLSGTAYEPTFKNVFLPGETLQVTCGITYYIVRPDQTSTKTKCKADGQWTIRPICQEVICSNEKHPHLSYWGVWQQQQKKIGDTAYYTCKSGYVNTNGAERATCTRDGWTPNPLCQGTQCQQLDIENAYITDNNKRSYRHGEAVEYTCRSTGKQFTISCHDGAWTGMERCPSDDSCVKETFPNGFFVGPFKHTIFYTCDVSYKLPTNGWWGTAKCLGGQWSGLQACIEKAKCGEPPEVPNGKATALQLPYKEAQILQITCKKGYSPDIDQLTCQDGNWHSNGTSLTTLCRLITPVCSPPPKVENAVVLEAYQREFLSDSTITYQCRDNFTMEGEDTIKCIAGQWEEKSTTCIQKPCPLPKDTPNGTYKMIFGNKFVVGTTIKYTCNEGFQMIGEYDTQTCLLDGWTNREPICQRATCKTQVTHPKLRVTGLLASGETMEYGHTLDFECTDDYQLDGASQIRCLQSGEWSASFPTCSETCKITGVPPNVNHQHVGNELLKGRNLTFSCQLRSHFIQGHATVQCLDDGQWSHPFPTCGTPVNCGNPPPLVDGDTKQSLKYVYRHNERVEFRCQNYYIMDGDLYRTCFNGEWRGDMKCLKPCTVNAEAMNTRNIRFRYVDRTKLYCRHGDEMEFECTRGRPVQSGRMRTRCLDGEIHLPTCQ